MLPIATLRRKWPLLGLGFALAFCSGPGQTYFISLFAGGVRADLSLSDGEFGAIYSFATLASAACLIWIGKFADGPRPIVLATGVLAGLSVATLLMANASGPAGLFAAVFALRLSGQGMLSHLTATFVARWFSRERGRALGLATLGFPAGEASLPVVAALALAHFGWREVWVAVAAAILFVAAPAIALLGAAARRRGLDLASATPVADDAELAQGDVASWTRAEALRDWRFYALAPGLLASPAIITGALFHQVRLVETKGWNLAAFAGLYPAYAVASAGAAIAFGALIDRAGAARALPLTLAPLALGLAIVSRFDDFAAGLAFMALMGATGGAAAVTPAALWSEIYGVAHLGAIRALATSAMVFGTALAPGAMGVLIDRGVSLEDQFATLSAYAAACCVGFHLLSSHLGPKPAPPSRK